MDQQDKFALSEQFQQFEALSESALKDVREAEKRTQGINLPINTQFKGHVISIKGSVSPVRQEEGVSKGGNPTVTVQVAVISPEQFKGEKLMRNFSFYDTANMTKAQRYGMFLDWVENVGCPREVRVQGVAAICAWFGANVSKVFDFVVYADNYGTEGKNFRGVPPAQTGPLPTASATASAIAQNVPADQKFPVGSSWLALGQEVQVVSISGNQIKVKVKSTGMEFPASADQLTPIT